MKLKELYEKVGKLVDSVGEDTEVFVYSHSRRTYIQPNSLLVIYANKDYGLRIDGIVIELH